MCRPALFRSPRCPTSSSGRRSSAEQPSIQCSMSCRQKIVDLGNKRENGSKLVRPKIKHTYSAYYYYYSKAEKGSYMWISTNEERIDWELLLLFRTCVVAKSILR